MIDDNFLRMIAAVSADAVEDEAAGGGYFCQLCGAGPLMFEPGSEPTPVCHVCAQEAARELGRACSVLHVQVASATTTIINLQVTFQAMSTTIALLRERLDSTAMVPCAGSPEGKRFPMKCFPNDPCTWCRARALQKTLDGA